VEQARKWADADVTERENWLRSGLMPLDYRPPVAADFPDLLAIVEERVKPERMAQNDEYGRRRWWNFLRPRPELHAAIDGLPRVMACSRIANAFAFTFMPGGIVLNEKIVVFPFAGCGPFASIQSRIHEVWARFFSSTLKDDLQYTPSECFETFPFAADFENQPGLERAGREYYEFRAALMVRNNEGLTKTYNRFHDPGDMSADIVRLRELHDALDRAVLDAYSWTDLRPTCEFLLDYDDEADAGDEPPPRARQRRKPWRYRWPDDVRDEVLARLLKLNADRAEQERRTGAAAAAAHGQPRRRSRRNTKGT
ncbi:MAG: type IIL restriction-modification enzyme MmeI, partial [Pirellulales bacterium]